MRAPGARGAEFFRRTCRRKNGFAPFRRPWRRKLCEADAPPAGGWLGCLLLCGSGSWAEVCWVRRVSVRRSLAAEQLRYGRAFGLAALRHRGGKIRRRKRYLRLDFPAGLEYNNQCVPKTAGGASRKSCRGWHHILIATVLVSFCGHEGVLFLNALETRCARHINNSNGGETKNA